MPEPTSRSAAGPQRVLFHYIKGNLFRVAHVDGAIGGITPRGFLHVSFYSERPAIPQSAEHLVSETGVLGEMVDHSGRQGIVRELDIDLIMTKETATDLRNWLTQRIDELEAALQKVRQTHLESTKE